MVDVQQIAVELEVAITTSLHCGIGSGAGRRARWEAQFGKDSKRGQRGHGKTLGVVISFIDDKL